jgi:hypothetical protein
MMLSSVFSRCRRDRSISKPRDMALITQKSTYPKSAIPVRISNDAAETAGQTAVALSHAKGSLALSIPDHHADLGRGPWIFNWSKYRMPLFLRVVDVPPSKRLLQNDARNLWTELRFDSTFAANVTLKADTDYMVDAPQP